MTLLNQGQDATVCFVADPLHFASRISERHGSEHILTCSIQYLLGKQLPGCASLSRNPSTTCVLQPSSEAMLLGNFRIRLDQDIGGEWKQINPLGDLKSIAQIHGGWTEHWHWPYDSLCKLKG